MERSHFGTTAWAFLISGAVFLGSAAVGQADESADWLKAEGHSAAWVAKTAKSRQLLAKPKLSDPMVKKYLPSIKRSAER